MMKEAVQSKQQKRKQNLSDVNEIANSDSVDINTTAQSHDKIELKDEMIGILLEKMNSKYVDFHLT